MQVTQCEKQSELHRRGEPTIGQEDQDRWLDKDMLMSKQARIGKIEHMRISQAKFSGKQFTKRV